MRHDDPSDFNLDMVWSIASLFTQVIAGALLTLGLIFFFSSYHLGIFTQCMRFSLSLDNFLSLG